MQQDSRLLLEEASQAQRERLAFVELRAFFTGELRRSDIETRFGIKPAASSRDLALYKELAPENLHYDLTRRCYRPAAKFAPIFELKSDRVLAWLLQGFGDGLDLGLKRTVPCEGAGQLMFPDLNILGQITRGICSKQALVIDYAESDLSWFNEAFDYVVAQKFLPKLQGWKVLRIWEHDLNQEKNTKLHKKLQRILTKP